MYVIGDEGAQHRPSYLQGMHAECLTPYSRLTWFPNFQGAGMVSSAVPGASRLQFFHSITLSFSPYAFGSHLP